MGKHLPKNISITDATMVLLKLLVSLDCTVVDVRKADKPACRLYWLEFEIIRALLLAELKSRRFNVKLAADAWLVKVKSLISLPQVLYGFELCFAVIKLLFSKQLFRSKLQEVSNFNSPKSLIKKA